MKKTNKITIFYMGSSQDTFYNCRVTTVTQLKEWKKKRHKNIKDAAFILEGEHSRIESYKLSSYLLENNLEKLSLYDF